MAVKKAVYPVTIREVLEKTINVAAWNRNDAYEFALHLYCTEGAFTLNVDDDYTENTHIDVGNAVIEPVDYDIDDPQYHFNPPDHGSKWRSYDD